MPIYEVDRTARPAQQPDPERQRASLVGGVGVITTKAVNLRVLGEALGTAVMARGADPASADAKQLEADCWLDELEAAVAAHIYEPDPDEVEPEPEPLEVIVRPSRRALLTAAGTGALGIEVLRFALHLIL